ncbi:MAG: hypothetical protein AB7D36_09010 [Oscillospiraceae bacterium]
MTNEEIIMLKLTEMQRGIVEISDKLNSVEDKLDTLTEAHEETRNGVNRLLEWADECGYIIKLPLPKI